MIVLSLLVCVIFPSTKTMINQIEALEMNVARANEQTEQVNAKKIQRLEEMFAIMLEDIMEIKVSVRALREHVEHVGTCLPAIFQSCLF